MATVLLVLVVVLVVAALVYGVVSLLAGDDPGLEAVEADGRALPLPNNRSLTELDLKTVRFDLGLRGYRMAQVDRVLRRTAYDVGYKDEMIAVLEAEVIALREGRTEDAELLRKARESASSPPPAASVALSVADTLAVVGDLPAHGALPTLGALPTVGAFPAPDDAGLDEAGMDEAGMDEAGLDEAGPDAAMEGEELDPDGTVDVEGAVVPGTGGAGSVDDEPYTGPGRLAPRSAPAAPAESATPAVPAVSAEPAVTAEGAGSVAFAEAAASAGMPEVTEATGGSDSDEEPATGSDPADTDPAAGSGTAATGVPKARPVGAPAGRKANNRKRPGRG